MKNKKLKSEDVKSDEIEKDDIQETEETTAAAEETEDSKAEPAQPEKAAGQNLMYIGPTVTNVIVHATVFKDGILPKKVERAISLFKPMRELFIPVDEIQAALAEIRNNTGAKAMICRKVPEKITGGKL